MVLEENCLICGKDVLKVRFDLDKVNLKKVR